jgi:hypothetical protein
MEFIAGPGETEEEFNRRVEYCLSLSDSIEKEFPELGGVSQVDPEALALTEKLYQISPNWVPIFYSNHDLPPWHGGCAWIFQKDEKGPKGALLQLRKGWFSNKSALFGFYTKKEIVAHELCHASRMAFDEPKYEEILAYETSHSTLRKWIGPLARSRVEAMIFFLTIVLLLFLDVMLFVTGNETLYTELMGLKLIPVALLTFALLRVAKAKYTLKKFCRKMGENGLAIAFRLTDGEIDRFSKLGKGELENELTAQKLRWSQIRPLL